MACVEDGREVPCRAVAKKMLENMRRCETISCKVEISHAWLRTMEEEDWGAHVEGPISAERMPNSEPCGVRNGNPRNSAHIEASTARVRDHRINTGVYSKPQCDHHLVGYLLCFQAEILERILASERSVTLGHAWITTNAEHRRLDPCIVMPRHATSQRLAHNERNMRTSG